LAGCLAETGGEDTGVSTSEAKKTDAEIAASCSQENPKKVAICHIPPGNPANAHTICISENAVDTHNSHHGDYIGACDPGTGGSGGGGATSGSGGSTSSSGSGGSGTTTSSSGAGGGDTPNEGCPAEYPTACVDDADCALGESCLLGCCVPFTN
jgi:hypothetical protein